MFILDRIQRIVLLFLFVALTSASLAFADETEPSTQSENHTLTLSLSEAILLAVRTNPNVQSARLTHVMQKFNVSVQEWQFYPHYGFQATAALASNTANNSTTSTQSFDVQPSVTWVSPYGTEANLSSANTATDRYQPAISLQVMQPLLRGFGKAIVQAALNNARDDELIARLNVEGTLRNTVTAVINAYLDVLMANEIVHIDEEALKRSALSVKQTQWFIKAGHKAGNELVTVKANQASAKSQLENDRNRLLQARYALLAAIGLDPNTDVKFLNLDVDQLINQYQLPSLVQTKTRTLQNDIQYQIDNMTLNGPTTRALLVAEDNTRWQLNLIGTAGTGGGGSESVLTALNNVNRSQSIGVALQIPINDQLAKQAVVNAKIALRQANLALLQEKWSKETGAINSWNQALSMERSLYFAKDARKLQTDTYQLSYQKYLHGLIDGLELQSAEAQLIQSEQALLNARIGYIKALVNLDLLTGNTLQTWQIKTRM